MPEWPEGDGSRVAYENGTEEKDGQKVKKRQTGRSGSSEGSGDNSQPERDQYHHYDSSSSNSLQAGRVDYEVVEDEVATRGRFNQDDNDDGNLGEPADLDGLGEIPVDGEAGGWSEEDAGTLRPRSATVQLSTSAGHDHEAPPVADPRPPLRLVVNNPASYATGGDHPGKPLVVTTTPLDLNHLESALIEGGQLWRLEWQWSSKNRQSLRRRRFIRVDSKWVKDTGPGSVVYIRYFDHATAEAIKKRGSNVIKKLVEAFLADRLRRNA